jgi:hypothetical protein
MLVKMEVEFNRDDLCKICKQEYRNLFGNPPEGFELEAHSEYGCVTVSCVRLPTPEPVAEPSRDVESAAVLEI